MKKGKDEHTPKGILEFCAESFVPEMQTSCLGSSESKRSRARSHWRSFLNRFTKNSVIRFPSLTPVMSKRSRGKSQSARENVLAVNTFNSSWKNFSLVELQNATKNFHHGLLFVPDLKPTILFFFLFNLNCNFFPFFLMVYLLYSQFLDYPLKIKFISHSKNKVLTFVENPYKILINASTIWLMVPFYCRKFDWKGWLCWSL